MERAIGTAAAAVVAAGLTLYPGAGAAAQVTVVGELIHEREATAGEAFTGVVRVTNPSAVAQRVRITSADVVVDSSGYRVRPSGSHERSNAGWLALEADDFVLPAGGTVAVRYAVDVPAHPPGSGSGSYWSSLLVRGTPEPEGGEDARGLGTSARMVVQFGIQVVTHVLGPDSRAVEFVDPSVDEDGVLRVSIANRGDRAVRPAMRIEAYDGAGVRVDIWTPDRKGLLLPGRVAPLSFDLSRLTPGPYSVLLLVDVGADVVHATRLAIQR
jgi:hypothetical protein